MTATNDAKREKISCYGTVSRSIELVTLVTLLCRERLAVVIAEQAGALSSF